MFKFYSSIFALLLLAFSAVSQPFTVLRTNIQEDLQAVAIAKNGTVYIGGNTGALASSTDNGATWRTIPLPPNAATDSITDIHILGNDTVLVFSRHRLIVTRDGWRTSSVRPFGFTGISRKASVMGLNHIWVCTTREPSGLFRSTDLGVTWDSIGVHPASIASFLDVKFANTQVGFAVGGGFRAGTRNVSVYRTINGGLRWDSVQSFPRGLNGFNQQWAVHAKDQGIWYSVGAKNMVSVTTDTGRSWTLLTQVDNSQPYLRSIGGSGDTLLAFGESGYGRHGYYTHDGGQVLNDLPSTWVNQTQFPITGNQQRLVATAYKNRVGYSVAGRGSVIRLTAASMGFITSLAQHSPKEKLVAWPNPVKSNAILSIRVNRGHNHLVELWSSTGQVTSLNLVAHDGDTAQVQLPASIVPGIYVLTHSGGKATRILVE